MHQFYSFKQENIRHGSVGEKIDLNNILEVAEADKLVYPEQVHGKKIYLCQKDDEGIIKNVDGLITNNKEQALVIKTADCIPIFLYNSSKEKIGLIHAGFKGLIKGIIKNTIQNYFNPKETIVGLGPHIRKDHYYLRGPNKKYYKENNLKRYFYKKDDKLYFSITELAKDQLLEEGIKKENIEDCGICTYCSNKFLSAREQGDEFECFGSFIKL